MNYRARVENNVDPKGIKRVQVRVLGVHSFDEKDVPLECLPWAEPAIPITVGKVDGGYGKHDVPDVDDWVWVFFEDDYKQKPHYFAIIQTEKDVNPKYKQGDGSKITKRDDLARNNIKENGNSVDVDRWDNTKIIDKEKTTWHNGSKTVQYTIKEDGNVVFIMDNKTGKVLLEIAKDGNVNLDISTLAQVASFLIHVAKDFKVKTDPNGSIVLETPLGSFTIDMTGGITITNASQNIMIDNKTAKIIIDPTGNIILDGTVNIMGTAKTMISLTAPTINLTGAVTISGMVTAGGGMTTSTPANKPITMVELMAMLANHTHVVDPSTYNAKTSTELIDLIV